MAGDWIKMRTELASDPCVIAIANRLCETPRFLRWLAPGFSGNESLADPGAVSYLVIGALHRLWSASQNHTEDGFLAGLTIKNLETIVPIPGFAEAIEVSGWAVYDSDRRGVCLPNFSKHNGLGAKARILKAERQGRWRAAHNVDAQAPTKRLLEKRREESIYSAAAQPTHADSRKPAKRKPVSNKPRERDTLFDAVAQVTASDPQVSGAHIGRVCKALRSAEPPYTPKEVHDWAVKIRKVPWYANAHGDGPPTLGTLEKYIGRMRDKSQPSPEDDDWSTVK